MNQPNDYNINLDVRLGFLELIDVSRLVAECTETWSASASTTTGD